MDLLDALEKTGLTAVAARALLTRTYAEPWADQPDPDFRETLAGGHALIVQYGDCELIGSCQCGKDLGTVTPDKPIDRFAAKWERHCMTEVTS
ncbi:hypothetical protein [Streptomyces sp. AcH 505]|uniref:hypothetical protein n=1 Tax=Streptomyces sp. AcH 505 TaxID=352211 RepID=UPI0012FE8F0D